VERIFRSYLVRFGGAGAVFPFLLVVRRICTPAALPHVFDVNVDIFEFEPESKEKQEEHQFLYFLFLSLI
jgi:hypothetical protein